VCPYFECILILPVSDSPICCVLCLHSECICSWSCLIQNRLLLCKISAFISSGMCPCFNCVKIFSLLCIFSAFSLCVRTLNVSLFCLCQTPQFAVYYVCIQSVSAVGRVAAYDLSELGHLNSFCAKTRHSRYRNP